MNRIFGVAAFAAACVISLPASAQSIGGNATQTFDSSGEVLALPASNFQYPLLLIIPASGSTQALNFALGTNSSVAATTSSPVLPPGGICMNVGPNKYL